MMKKNILLRCFLIAVFGFAVFSLQIFIKGSNSKAYFQPNNPITVDKSDIKQQSNSAKVITKAEQMVSTRSGIGNLSEVAQREAISPPFHNPIAIHPPKKAKKGMERNLPIPEKFLRKSKPAPTIKQLTVDDDINPLVDSPLPAASFQALSDNGTSIPPDTHGAVGPNHLMVATNSQIRIQDRTGRELKITSLNGFWQNLGLNGRAFDPKVLYDALQDRWILVADANGARPDSAIYVAVTLTGDPTQTWRGYSFRADNTGVNWADYPGVGINDNMLVITNNYFSVSQNRFQFVSTLVINKNTLYTAPNSLSSRSFSDDSTFTAMPSVALDSGESSIYLVSSFNSNFNGEGFLRLDRISGTPENPTLTLEVNFPSSSVPWRFGGPKANQSGTSNSIDTGDHRMQSVVMRNGLISCTHTIFLPEENPNRAAVQYWQFDTDGNVIQNTILEDPSGEFFVAYPSVAVNQNDDVLIGFSIFGRTIFASNSYSFRSGTDSPNVFRDNIILKAGEASYFKTFSGNNNRWGDYSNTVVDPNGIDFWTIQEYSAGTDIWGTWWGRVNAPTNTPTGSVSLAVSPASQNLEIGRSVNATLAINRNSFSGPVDLQVFCAASACPPGITFSRTSFSSTNSSESIVVSANSSAIPGSYQFFVRGRANGITIPDSSNFTINVTRPVSTGVTLSLSPGSTTTINAGDNILFNLDLSRTNFTGDVTVKVLVNGNVPDGLSLDKQDFVVNSNFTTFTLFTDANRTAAGSFNIFVRGSAQGITIPDSSAIAVVVNKKAGPTINTASYGKPFLDIFGSNFDDDASVFVNGSDVSFRTTSVSSSSIRLKGNKGKLGLTSGSNQVFVMNSDGSISNIVTFNLLADDSLVMTGAPKPQGDVRLPLKKR